MPKKTKRGDSQKRNPDDEGLYRIYLSTFAEAKTGKTIESFSGDTRTLIAIAIAVADARTELGSLRTLEGLKTGIKHKLHN